MDQNFESLVKTAKDEIVDVFPYLQFTLKIKKLKNNNWLALYRSGTAVIGGRPIVWINSDFPSVISIHENTTEEAELGKYILLHLKDTISHELIHAIQEIVQANNGSSLLRVKFDEDEAESLGLKLARGETISNHPLIRNFLDNCCG